MQLVRNRNPLLIEDPQIKDSLGTKTPAPYHPVVQNSILYAQSAGTLGGQRVLWTYSEF
jgi:hypothetical protein